MHHIQLRIHKWVIWWLCLGLVCGVIALSNILFRDLTRTQDKIILLVGVVHWVLGGVVCWAFDGIKFTSAPPAKHDQTPRAEPPTEWHSASDFVQPGGRKSLLPPRY